MAAFTVPRSRFLPTSLFLSIQHPGEESKTDDPKGWTSTWPDGVPGKPARPRPSVVAIQGFKW